MIINEATNSLFLEIPKTGSTTIRLSYQKKHGRSKYASVWTHVKINELPRVTKEFFPEVDLDKTTLYAFYRDPIDRIISGWRYSLSQWELSRTNVSPNFDVYERAAAVFHLLRREPFNVEEKPSLNNVTFDEYLDALESRVFFTTIELLSPQTNYLNDDVVLLNFHDYENEYRRLTPILDLPPIEEGLGRTNSSDAELYFDKVTETQVQRIKAFYKKDYEFFAKKGITFRERTFD